jgi:hypothetical protein
MELHAKRTGHVEGVGRADLLRYLRHEMGHVVNYAYKLYEREDWTKVFGSMTQPYLDDYRPAPFSRRYVRHLPGWYAQKHPDEDWSETFAVWMTPGLDWRRVYRDWPTALGKLEFCDRLMAELRDKDPPVTTLDLDEDVTRLTVTLDQYYQQQTLPGTDESLPPGLDGALLAIFEDWGRPEPVSPGGRRLPAADLIRKLELPLLANVYRWTGHFPERTRPLVRHLAKRAEELNQVYPADREAEAVVAVTTLVTALAMNYVHKGTYVS